MKESFLKILQRYLRAKLSFLYEKYEVKTSKIESLIREIQLFLDYIPKVNKNFKVSTHKIFSNRILNLVKEGSFLNFLQKSFIQQMFFIHNRFYLLNYLLELKKADKWFFWKKIIKETNIGNPVRFFFYPMSSGNKIFQAYHLKQYEDFSNINLKEFNLVVEFGGGYGNMACMFQKINPTIKYIIFDTFEVNLLQYYYLRRNRINVIFNENIKKAYSVYLTNSINSLKSKIFFLKKKNNKKLFIANWSLSETPIKLRNSLKFLFSEFDYQLISFQKKFENINNYNYFFNLLKYNQSKKRFSEIQSINQMNNHFYLFSKR